MLDTIIYLLITMAFSAFFSGMEIAFVSVDKLRFEMDKKAGVTSAILSYFFRNPNDFISTMLVGNNIALVIYGIFMAQIIEGNLLAGVISNHFAVVLIQTIISTLVILVTGEFLPKTLFKINPNLALRVCAMPLFVCYVVLFPVSKLASGLSSVFCIFSAYVLIKRRVPEHLERSIWIISSSRVSKMPKVRRIWMPR